MSPVGMIVRSQICYGADGTLGGSGQRANDLKRDIDTLILELNSPDVQKKATQTLIQIGEKDPDLVIPALAKALEDNDVDRMDAQASAEKILGQIGAKYPNIVVPVLVKILDRNPTELWVLVSVINAFKSITSKNPTALEPELVERLRKINSFVSKFRNSL